MRSNPVASALRSGGVAIGTFALEFVTTGLPRTAASAGADFVVLDCEHSGFTSETLRSVLAAARGTPIVPMVRVPTLDPHAISVALDLGALGIMVPRVETVEEARAAVLACRYPPEGRRGFGILHVDEHDGEVGRYLERANREILLIVQIESATALDSLEEIASVAEVDVLWVGQYDLTASLGIPGQFDHRDVVDALNAVAGACSRHGKAAGMATDDLEHARLLLDQGFRCLAYGHDLTLYRRALAQGIERLRRHEPALSEAAQ